MGSIGFGNTFYILSHAKVCLVWGLSAKISSETESHRKIIAIIKYEEVLLQNSASSSVGFGTWPPLPGGLGISNVTAEMYDWRWR